MRQVNRPEQSPKPLQNISQSKIDQVKKPGDADGTIYRHSDVLDALCQLYLGKCYLCEEKIQKHNAVIEHFHPYAKNCPNLAYDWNNLNFACRPCNDRKRINQYKTKKNENMDCQKTILIDPSKPPFEANIEDLIQFNNISKAISCHRLKTDPLIKNTLEFLNDTIPHDARLSRKDSLSNTIIQLGESKPIVAKWRKLILQNPISPSKWPKNDKEAFDWALEKADHIYNEYLNQHAPFSASLSFTVVDICNITKKDFKKMSDAYRVYKSLPLWEEYNTNCD